MEENTGAGPFFASPTDRTEKRVRSERVFGIWGTTTHAAGAHHPGWNGQRLLANKAAHASPDDALAACTRLNAVPALVTSSCNLSFVL